jgi:hypothetical protein
MAGRRLVAPAGFPGIDHHRNGQEYEKETEKRESFLPHPGQIGEAKEENDQAEDVGDEKIRAGGFGRLVFQGSHVKGWVEVGSGVSSLVLFRRW